MILFRFLLSAFFGGNALSCGGVTAYACWVGDAHYQEPERVLLLFILVQVMGIVSYLFYPKNEGLK